MLKYINEAEGKRWSWTKEDGTGILPNPWTKEGGGG